MELAVIVELLRVVVTVTADVLTVSEAPCAVVKVLDTLEVLLVAELL